MALLDFISAVHRGMNYFMCIISSFKLDVPFLFLAVVEMKHMLALMVNVVNILELSKISLKEKNFIFVVVIIIINLLPTYPYFRELTASLENVDLAVAAAER